MGYESLGPLSLETRVLQQNVVLVVNYWLASQEESPLPDYHDGIFGVETPRTWHKWPHIGVKVLLEVPDTIATLVVWDHTLGNYAGPYSGTTPKWSV